MTSSCTETVNGAPQETNVVVVEVPVVKRGEEVLSGTTTVDRTPSMTPVTAPDDSSSASSTLDLDFGVMGVSEGLPEDEDELEFGMVMGASACLHMEDAGFPGVVTTTTTGNEVEKSEENENASMPVGEFIMGAAVDAVPMESVFEEKPNLLVDPGMETVETVKAQLRKKAVADEEKVLEGPPKAETESELWPQETTEKELESTPAGDDTATPPEEEKKEDSSLSPKRKEPLTFGDTLRKGAVAVAGGTLTAVGLVMIPLPTPCGALVAGSGMALLGTEFEAANRVMERLQSTAEKVRDQMIDNIEAALEDDACPTEVDNMVIAKLPQSDTTASTSKPGNDSNAAGETSTTDEPTLDKPTQFDTSATSATTEDGDEFLISVNADPYFDEKEQAINKGGFVNNFVFNPLQNAKQRIDKERKGWLANSLLPMLKSTKNLGSGANKDANNTKAKP